MTELTGNEMLERIKRGLAGNSARFHRKIIVYEGLGRCWGAVRGQLFDTLQRHGWRTDGEKWQPPLEEMGGDPTEAEFEIAYAHLCEAVPPVSGMSRDNMQPLAEGSYPDGAAWVEEFASYPELRIEGSALVFQAAPMTPLQHVRYLKDRAEACRLDALRSRNTLVSSVAQDLETRADEIGRENSLPSAASDGWI